MFFLPNKFTRYTAALRNSVQLSVIKHGIQEKSLESLMKIHKAEALFEQNTAPLCVGEFSEILLSAAFLTLLEKGKMTKFSVNIKGDFLIDRKLYTALLLTAYKNCDSLSIKKHREQIVIKIINAEITQALPFIKVINAHHFLERKTKTALIIIKADSTEKHLPLYENEWDYILNPFSEVNIYLQ